MAYKPIKTCFYPLLLLVFSEKRDNFMHIQISEQCLHRPTVPKWLKTISYLSPKASFPLLMIALAALSAASLGVSAP